MSWIADIETNCWYAFEPVLKVNTPPSRRTSI